MEINEKYRIENIKLGSGSFSQVYLGVEISTNRKVAIKIIPLNNKNTSNLDKFNREITLMQQMDHPNIVKYYDVVKTENTWYIIMEYCNIGTLQDVIAYNIRESEKIGNNFDREKNTCYYLNQLKQALYYIKKNKYTHRDIKPMNVLLTSSDNTIAKTNLNYTQQIIVKLADFGLAREYDDTQNGLMKTICGSPLYMAPELFTDNNYNETIDLWSFGVIFYQMLFGTLPTNAKTISSLKNNILNKDIDFHLHKKFTRECFDLLQGLLHKDYKTRISWPVFFNHKWFKLFYDANPDINVHTTNENCCGLEFTQIKPASKTPDRKLGMSNLTKMIISHNLQSNVKQINYNEHPSSFAPRQFLNESNTLHKSFLSDRCNINTNAQSAIPNKAQNTKYNNSINHYNRIIFNSLEKSLCVSKSNISVNESTNASNASNASIIESTNESMIESTNISELFDTSINAIKNNTAKSISIPIKK